MNCWIFDVDGTLANTAHRKVHLENKPKRWDLWNAGMADDDCHKDIADFVNSAIILNIPVIICTGREEDYREITHNWLVKHNIKYDVMLMRRSKDYRSDDIIKKEMLDELKALGYTPSVVFDDRDRVVKMWRENGIRCFQVAEGDF